MDRYQYTSIEPVVAQYLRDFKGMNFEEDEIIEWIGDALSFLKAPLSEEAVAFLEVRNHTATLPNGLHYVIQIARDITWQDNKENCSPQAISEILVNDPVIENCEECQKAKNFVPLDCQGNIIGPAEVAYYRPYFDLQYEFFDWVQRSANFGRRYIPVRLANHSFFSSLVCTTEQTKGLYNNNNFQYDEYTIAQNTLRFSFKEGFIALAYLRQRVDPETGYPLIPDDILAKTAITYFLAWKTKQREAYMHREGAFALAEEAEKRWSDYLKKFKNQTKMPFGIDDYQDLQEQSNYLIPRHRRYYGFFGKLGKEEDRIFNDPTFRNKYRFLSGNTSYVGF